MQASARYRIPQRRNNAKLPRLIPLSHEDVFDCRRCGEACTAVHYCKAVNRQCFGCRRYGHYSKLCNEGLFRKQAGLPSTDKPTRKTKSIRKQQRDQNRYLQYKERKAVCLIMPFFDTSDQEINSNAPKATKTCHDIQELYRENALLTMENKDLWEQMNREHQGILLKLTTSLNKNAALQNENAKQASQITNLHQQVQSKVNQIQTQDDTIQELNSSLTDQVRLELKVEEQDSIIKEQDLEILASQEHFEDQINTLSRRAEISVNIAKVLEHRIRELEQVVTHKKKLINTLTEELQHTKSMLKSSAENRSKESLQFRSSLEKANLDMQQNEGTIKILMSEIAEVKREFNQCSMKHKSSEKNHSIEINNIKGELQKAADGMCQRDKTVKILRSKLKEADDHITKIEDLRERVYVHDYDKNMMCGRCGNDYKHSLNKCPAKGEVCLKCRGINHLTTYCTSKFQLTHWDSPEEYCRKCGHDSEHLPSMCPAKGNMCKICCVYNHFTAMHGNHLHNRPI